MNHYHMIYTPKGLHDLLPEAVPYDRYITCYEMGQGGRHAHIYIETDYEQDKLRDTLKDVQHIPTGKRGKKSLHYSCRLVAEHPPDYPTQDLRKFTLGYVQKNNDRSLMKGYTEEELQSALNYYHEQRKQLDVLSNPPVQIQSNKEEDSINGQWAEYVVFFEKLLKEPLVSANMSVQWFRLKSRSFWRTKNNGLHPQASKSRRFLYSILDLYRQNLKIQDGYQDDMKSLGA